MNKRGEISTIFVICSLLLVTFNPMTTFNIVKGENEDDVGIHIMPYYVYIYPEQISPNGMFLGLLAVYENVFAAFMVNRTELIGNNIIVFVDSIKIEDTNNVTTNTIMCLIENLSTGVYHIEIIENELNLSISNTTSEMRPYYRFMNSNEIIGGLETFAGKKINDTIYMIPSPGVPTLPPALFEYTAFWANSTDYLFLAVNLSNIGSVKDNLTFSLFSQDRNIDITPNLCNIGRVNASPGNESYKLCIFEISINNASVGIHNLTYYCNYTMNASSYSLTGNISVGIYSLYVNINTSDVLENIKANATLFTPFDDIVNFSYSNWSAFPIENGSVFLPTQSNYTCYWSNFSLQEPHSPWLHALIGGVAGFVAGFVGTAVTQYLSSGKIDWGQCAVNGVIGGISGAVIVGTFGAGAQAVAPLTAGSIARNIGTSAVTGAVLNGGLNAVTQFTSGEEFDGKEFAASVIGGAAGGAAGAATANLMGLGAAYLRVSNVMNSGGFKGGGYKAVNDAWAEGTFNGRMNAVYKYAKMTNNLKGIPFATKMYKALPGYKKVSLLHSIFKDSAMYFIKHNSEFTDSEGSAQYIQSLYANPYYASQFSQDDADGDGVINIVELQQGTNPFDSSDGPLTIDLIAPTSSNPVLVGDPSNPLTFIATVETSYPVLNPEFHVEVGGRQANVAVLMSDPQMDFYILRVFPPDQPSEGPYNLKITLSISGITKDCDIENNAVKYSTGSNVDVMTVIDRSGSMRGPKIAAAKNAAFLFVDLMTLHDMIGVASFSSGASINYPLTEITSDSVKQQAKNKINSISAGGATSIGAGLQAGYNQLLSKGNAGHPWSIILLSDGHHNTPPHPNSILPLIQAANIRVFTIGLGSDADANMLSYIAHNSGGGGGEYYYSPSEAELNAIYNAISGIVKSESIILNVDGSVNVGETVAHDVYIDSSISTATFTISWKSGSCDLELKRPDGSYVDPSAPDVISHVEEATYETFTIDNPTNGHWTMEITRTHASSLTYNAIVTAKTNISLTCYINKDKYFFQEPIKIISTVAQSGIPITTANVTVKIKRPDGSVDYILLSDDGKHDDWKPHDGVYSNSYTNTDQSGSYTIIVTASGMVDSERFTRIITKSIYVEGSPSSQITLIPSVIDLGVVHPLEEKFISFKIKSSSSDELGFTLSATDFINQTNNGVIDSKSITLFTDGFILPPYTSTKLFARFLIPSSIRISGEYTGNIVLRSSSFSTSLPIKMRVIADTTPPNTEIKIGNPKYSDGHKWITSHTPINLTATDDISGVKIIYSRVWFNNLWSNWIEYTGNFTLKGECKHYLEYYSVDNAGNVEDVHNQTYYVDNTPPTTNKKYGEPYHRDEKKEWITSHTPIQLNPTDNPTCNPSGVNNTYYKIDNNEWKTYTQPFTIPGECQHTIHYYSADNLGNTEKIKNQTVYIDNTPPLSNITISEPKFNWTKHLLTQIIQNIPPEIRDIYLTLPLFVTNHSHIRPQAQDQGQCPVGIGEIYYRIWNKFDGWTKWQKYEEKQKPIDAAKLGFTLEKEGPHYIEYYSQDLLQNKEKPVHNLSCLVDDTPPTTEAFGYNPIILKTTEHGGKHPSKDPNHVTPPEEFPPVGLFYIHYRYKIGENGEWTNWFTSELKYFTGYITITHHSILDPVYVDYYATDILGNKEETHHDVFEPQTNPFHLELLSPQNRANNLDVNVNLRWSSNAQSYNIYLGKTTPPPLLVSGCTSTIYDPGVLDYGATYYWKIRAYNKNGQTKESPIWSFTTRNKGFGDPKHGEEDNQTTSLSIQITKPEKAFYLNNKKILTLHTPLIIGDIDIKAQTSGETGVKKVEIYIDNQLKASITTEPYTWSWSEKTFGKHTIKTVAYDTLGNSITREITVWKFL